MRYQKLIRKMDGLKEKGYLSQYELGNMDKKVSIGNFKVPINETIVGMDRNGNLIRLVGGSHRIAIAQNIGIKNMTAILTIIHPNAVHKLPEKRRLITGKDEDFRPFG